MMPGPDGDGRPGPNETAQQRWNVLAPHLVDQIPLVELAAEHEVSIRTLRRWKADYLREGLAGLAPKARSDKGQRKIPDELHRFIEGTALTSPRPSIATITRRAAAVAAANHWAPASYAVVRSIVNNISDELKVMAHEGTVAWRDRYELVWRRQADLPNAMWQADHCELDILVLGPNDQPARPWLTVVLDDHSRAICGYLLFIGAPSTLNTGLALRQAIWPKADPQWVMCGIPELLYIDHGSDFTSHHLTQVGADLRMQLVYSTIARPQGRGKIERFFGSVNTEVLADLPGYLSPEGERGVPVPGLSLDELDTKIKTFIITYNHRVHSSTKHAPHQAWVQDGWLPRLPDSLEQLDGLLLQVAKARVVHRDGIRFQGLRYLSPTLAGYVGQSVTVRYDPRDLTEIRVFYKDEFLCKAIDPTHDSSTITLKQIQAARSARRRKVRSELNQLIAVTKPPAQERRPEPSPPEKPHTPRLKTYQEDI